MPISTNPVADFVVHMSGLHPGLSAVLKASVTPRAACSSADASKLSSPSQVPAGCDILKGKILFTSEQLSTCIGKIGLSNTCETCVSNLLSSMLSCLIKCNYKDGEISANPNEACNKCMTELVSRVYDQSNILASCGLDADASNQLFSDATGGTPDATIVGATTTKSASVVNRSIVVVGTVVALLTMM
jgi:hypothetical protein